MIRFISTDGRVLLGEPVDGELDIGLAMSSGQTIEAHVLGGKHAWEATAVRTGKTALVQTVSGAEFAVRLDAYTCSCLARFRKRNALLYDAPGSAIKTML